MIQEERYIKVTPKDIKDFKSKHYKKHIKLMCNEKDREHIPLILLSERKMGLSRDNNFIHDVINFPGFKNVVMEKRPQDLQYQ